MGVVHVISAALKADAAPEAVSAALERAHALRTAPGARRVLVGRAPQRLVTVAWLEGREAMEAFAASPEHMAFIMRGLAPCISGMWSAAVESAVEPPVEASALWVFAVRASETLFEWQVRDLVRDLGALPGTLAAGPTIEERERYRAGGTICLARSDVEAFGAALAEQRKRWGDLAGSIDDSWAEVVAP
jgi:heme-degrading monooxygenase HmoA